ncbi:MAG TPA: hypothetical protein VFV50_18440, partial [Bdellovibrionales bacterium]|nr:hypothetical protein [Bdellovibrionales bacterium]
MRAIVLLLASLLAGPAALGAKKDQETKSEFTSLTKEELARFKAPVQTGAPPAWDVQTGEAYRDIAANYKASDKRSPSGSNLVGSEDLLSDKFKREFRKEYLAIRDGYTYGNFLKKWDRLYDEKPNELPDDVKFAVLRLATMLPLQGVVWRAVPAVHNQIITQEMLLAQMKNMGQNMLIHEPDNHVKAQLGFMTLPHKDILNKRFKNEGDFLAYLSREVYPALQKAVGRLERLTANANSGKPLVFDGQIRWGDGAFEATYDARDRYRIIGLGEIYAQLARYHRRMAGIAQLVAYNWNGYTVLMKQIGEKYGIDIAKSKANEFFTNFGGEQEVYVDGLHRSERVAITRNHRNIWTLTPDGAAWMKRAWNHTVANVELLNASWNIIRDTKDPSEYMLIDPEVMQGRRDQVQKGVDNLLRLVRGNHRTPGVAELRGDISGDRVYVNLKAFYENPPHDLKDLLPTEFNKHNDISLMKQHFPDMKPVRDDLISMTVGDTKGVVWRNYLYDRAWRWDTSERAYGRLFPYSRAATSIGDARRI